MPRQTESIPSIAHSMHTANSVWHTAYREHGTQLARSKLQISRHSLTGLSLEPELTGLTHKSIRTDTSESGQQTDLREPRREG